MLIYYCCFASSIETYLNTVINYNVLHYGYHDNKLQVSTIVTPPPTAFLRVGCVTTTLTVPMVTMNRAVLTITVQTTTTEQTSPASMV